jgi:hypothetical protein
LATHHGSAAQTSRYADAANLRLTACQIVSLSFRRMNSNLRFLPRRLCAWIVSQCAALHTDSFALVMATGIISNALFVETHLLFVTNAVAYSWLAILMLLRCVRFPRAVWADLTNPHIVFSFFTLVASNGVFGAGVHLRGAVAVALALWIMAFGTWLVLIYFSFGVLTFLNTARGANVVHGGWLLAIVGTESLVILGTLIAPSTGVSALLFLYLSICCGAWGLGSTRFSSHCWPIVCFFLRLLQSI